MEKLESVWFFVVRNCGAAWCYVRSSAHILTVLLMISIAVYIITLAMYPLVFLSSVVFGFFGIIYWLFYNAIKEYIKSRRCR